MGFFPFFPSGAALAAQLAGQTIPGALTISSGGLTVAGGVSITSGNLGLTLGNVNTSLGAVSALALNSTTALPGMAAGANAGTGPPAPVVTAGSGNSAGSGTFGTGTTPAAGAMVVVTFANAFGATPGVVLMPGNTLTQALGLYVSAIGTAGFTVSCTTAPAASQANTIYAFEYLALG